MPSEFYKSVEKQRWVIVDIVTLSPLIVIVVVVFNILLLNLFIITVSLFSHFLLDFFILSITIGMRYRTVKINPEVVL